MSFPLAPQELLIQGLHAPEPLVRQLSLKTLQRCIASSRDAIEVCRDPSAQFYRQAHIPFQVFFRLLQKWAEVLVVAVESLADENTSVGLRAEGLLTVLGQTEKGINMLLQPPLRYALEDVAKRSVLLLIVRNPDSVRDNNTPLSSD